MIRKVAPGKWAVISHRTGRKLGTYPTRAQAKARLRQIQAFKARKK